MIDLGFILKKSFGDAVARATYTYLPFPQEPDGDEAHLAAVMQWLFRAAGHGRGGVSSHYSLLHGRWLPPFPETTGYIIPTFYDYGEHTGDDRSGRLAQRLADWLADVQLESGACMQGQYTGRRAGRRPLVFNTGQNLFGFLRTYRETGRERYLDAAVRAGDFLVGCTGRDGVWNRALHHDLPHTYNARTAWALLELYDVTGAEAYREVACANLDWVVAQQVDGGWFRHANFKPGELPNTHGLAYTLRGLLEASRLTGDGRYLKAARTTADRFLRLFEIRKFLYTFWDAAWQNHGKYVPRLKGRYVCVTGNVQLALVWMRLYALVGDATYASAAFKMIDFVKVLHDLTTRHDGVRGGVPGAFPIFGSYAVLKYPNWAAKFFADALMMKIRLMRDGHLARRAPALDPHPDAANDLAPLSPGGAERVEARAR